MPGSGAEHLGDTLEELGERDQDACNREPKIAGAGPASRRCHQADKGAHESKGENESDLDTQVEFKGDAEEKVIDEMDGREGGECDCGTNCRGVPL